MNEHLIFEPIKSNFPFSFEIFFLTFLNSDRCSSPDSLLSTSFWTFKIPPASYFYRYCLYPKAKQIKKKLTVTIL